MLAAVLFASAMVVVLVGMVVWMGFYQGLPGDPARHFTFSQYHEVFSDSETYAALLTTIGFSLIALVVSCSFGIPAAWLAERTDLPGENGVVHVHDHRPSHSWLHGGHGLAGSCCISGSGS